MQLMHVQLKLALITLIQLHAMQTLVHANGTPQQLPLPVQLGPVVLMDVLNLKLTILLLNLFIVTSKTTNVLMVLVQLSLPP